MKDKYSFFIKKWKITHLQFINYAKEFYNYSHPLLVYALVGLIIGLLDRWMLQKFGGSMEQGFYGLSYQIGAVCFLFTSAMTPLITREFAIAFEKNDLKEMARLFRRYIPMLYSIAAYFACFIAVQADRVTFIMGGRDFHQAATAVTIMSFYPIHQTYGQLSGSVFYATGQTRLYRNIGIFIMFSGLPLTYILIAPIDKMGLNAGAMGLAYKMIIIQFIGVNIQLYFNAKLLRLRFWWYLGHQMICVACFTAISFVAMFCINYCMADYHSMFGTFILSGILYTIFIILLFYFYPVIFGLNRQDVLFLIHSLFRKLRHS